MPDVTLDSFFAQTVPVEIANLGAQLGTERTDAADSVWQGDPYGSSLQPLLTRPDTAPAIRREIERGMAIVGLSGTVTVVDEVATIRTVSATLQIDREGVTLAAS